MYLIKNKKQVVGYVYNEKVQVIEPTLFPRSMHLGKPLDQLTMLDFYRWIKGRVFPEHRENAKELLDEMGLPRYSPLAIAERTNAELTGSDFFSIEVFEGNPASAINHGIIPATNTRNSLL